MKPVLVRRRAVVAPVLLAITVAWFLYGWSLAAKASVGGPFLEGSGDPRAMRILAETGAVTALDLLNGQWWRLLSNCFVHVGLIHLAGNMLMLGTLGGVSERLWGWRRFLIVYVGSGLAGSIAAMAFRPMSNGSISLVAGASGALWGVMLSVIVWFLKYRRQLPPEITDDWSRKLGMAFCFNLLVSFAPGVSLEAHLGGGFAGMALSLWLDRTARPNRGISFLGLCLLALIAVLSLTFAMRKSGVWHPLREAIEQPHQRLEPFNPPDQPADERSRVIEAMEAYDEKLSPERLSRLIARLKLNDLLMGKNYPKTIAETEAFARDVQAGKKVLEPFHGEFASQYLEYITRLEDVIKAIQDWQAKPPRSPIDEILERQKEVLKALERLSSMGI